MKAAGRNPGDATNHSPDSGLRPSSIMLDILGKTQQLRIDRNHLVPSQNG
jgi:hypothetical protein